MPEVQEPILGSRKRYQEWKRKTERNGTCISCNQRIVTGGPRRCSSCVSAAKIRSAEKRKKAMERGMCHYCYRRDSVAGMNSCDYCSSKRVAGRMHRLTGIDQRFVVEWIDKQERKCQICGTETNGGYRMNIDHDHSTGALRGLLCSRCNRLIGFACDRKEILMSAMKYLDHHKGKAGR